MPIVKAKDPQRVNMRRERLERFVSAIAVLISVKKAVFSFWRLPRVNCRVPFCANANERLRAALLEYILSPFASAWPAPPP